MKTERGGVETERGGVETERGGVETVENVDYCAAVNLSGKEQSLTVPRVLLWPTSFVHTEMLPVECSVVD